MLNIERKPNDLFSYIWREKIYLCSISSVLVIFCHITDYSKIQQTKTTEIYYLQRFLIATIWEEVSWVVPAQLVSLGFSQTVS